MISIDSARTGKAFGDFIKVPDIVHRDDPFFVPQLGLERRIHLGKKNPYFAHATAQYFVAYEDGKPVGRISAQIDQLAQKEGGGVLGHFGLLDAQNENALKALLKAAEDWLRSKGATTVAGPYSLSINDESGLLIEGFDTIPRMMMNHAKPWYGAVLEAAGYSKAKDLLAFRMDVSSPFPEASQRIATKALTIPGLAERPLDGKRLKPELQLIMGIFNDAWAGNWGFVPMTPEEITYTADNMKPLLRPDFARIVEINGVAAAMIVALPDLNEALAGLGGRLLPFGWARLLWRLKRPGVMTAGRCLLMGIREQYRGGFQGAAITALLVERLQTAMAAKGFKEIEMSWILEDNLAIIRVIENCGGKAYKRYRIYEKALT